LIIPARANTTHKPMHMGRVIVGRRMGEPT